MTENTGGETGLGPQGPQQEGEPDTQDHACCERHQTRERWRRRFGAGCNRQREYPGVSAWGWRSGEQPRQIPVHAAHFLLELRALRAACQMGGACSSGHEPGQCAMLRCRSGWPGLRRAMTAGGGP